MRSALKPKSQSNGEPTRPSNAGVEAYEVRCRHCDVSFPVGTKRCVHCGERTGVQPVFARNFADDPMADFGQPGDFSAGETSTARPIDFADEEEAEPRGTSMFRALGNLSWIILFVAITVYRSCAG